MPGGGARAALVKLSIASSINCVPASYTRNDARARTPRQPNIRASRPRFHHDRVLFHSKARPTTSSSVKICTREDDVGMNCRESQQRGIARRDRVVVCGANKRVTKQAEFLAEATLCEESVPLSPSPLFTATTK